MNLRDSLHSVKAAELLRRLITLEHRTLELDKKTVALMKKVLFNITSVYLFISHIDLYSHLLYIFNILTRYIDFI